MTLTTDKTAVLIEGTKEELDELVALVIKSDLRVTVAVIIDEKE